MARRFLTHTLIAAACLLATGAIAGPAVVEKLDAAKITLQQAIDAAENATEGRAFEAELDKDNFQVEYEVEVWASGKEYEVSVDAETGEILSIREEKD